MSLSDFPKFLENTCSRISSNNFPKELDKLQQYKETMNKHSRTLSDADENFKLEVYHDVHEFYKSRVDELSQQAIPEPRLYFRINQESIETCLDANIKFGIEN